ncbi:MAG: oligosaccharide flippase family protein [Saprospiraceae bacterium]|nr:oligosaccharide flippase family protein [Saprospiraceae bacterium]
MKKEFILNIILLLAINFLIKPFYLFGVDLHIQNIVGTDTYGMYKVLFNIAFLLQFVHEPGIQAFNSQNIAKDPQRLGFHLPRILGLKLILGVVYFILAIGYFLCNPYDASLLPLMIVITINLFLSTLFLFLRTNIASIGKYRTDSLLSSLDKLLMLIILGVLSWVSPFRENFEIIWLAYGQFAAFLISCIVALFILYKHLGILKISFSWDYAKKLLKWSLPYALILLSMSAYTRMDSIMIERILDDGGLESGIYEYGYRFLDAFNMVGYLFAALLLPMYASNLKNNKVINDLIDIGLRMMVLVTFVGAAAAITYRNEIMTWSNKNATPYYGEIMIYLMLSFIVLSIAYIFGSLLMASNRLKNLNIVLLFGVVLNFGLNMYLIPSEHALGAAKATLITQTIMALGQIILVYKLIKVKITLRLLLSIVVFGLLCALIFGSIYAYISIGWVYRAVLSISFTMIFALVLRLVDVKSITGLITRKKPT